MHPMLLFSALPYYLEFKLGYLDKYLLVVNTGRWSDYGQCYPIYLPPQLVLGLK